MGAETLIFDGQVIDMEIGSQGSNPIVSRVAVTKRRVIPLGSVTRVKRKTSWDIPLHFIETTEDLKVLIPRNVYSNETYSIVCVMNISSFAC